MEKRIYAKQELALLYFPDRDPHTAVINLNHMIHRCPPLEKALKATHIGRFSKLLTPKQVRLIVEYLGEP
jgi:hypothetical protein